MKYFYNLLLIVFLGSCVNYALATDQPAESEKPENVVMSLYRDFGREIQTDHALKAILIDQPTTVLERYFTQNLAELIAKDRKHEIKTKELGHLDFVVICGSQDPEGISNIRINKKPGSNVVDVLYDQNGEKDVMKMDYYIVHTQNGWRISDIHYKARKSTAFPDPVPEFSLLKLLSQPY